MAQKVHYEELPSKTILNQVTAPSMPFRWSINPYRGCQHGCSFCYARATHTFMGVAADDTFQNHIFLKSNAAEALTEQLDKLARGKGGLSRLGQVAIGTATDPYQQAEGNARLTRSCLEVLAKYGVPVSITTRSPLILRDLDVLKNLPAVTVNISLNTLDKTVWRSMEPSTPSPKQRLETIAALVEADIQAGIFMAPILPYLTDAAEDLEELIHEGARHQAKFMMSSFLRLSTQEVKVWFFQTLRDRFPHLVSKYAALYQSSAYAPSSYREPLKSLINDLLKRYGLNDVEAFRRLPTAGDVPAPQISENDPVQLSFSF
ncbi:radical SAM protein [Paenibacillus chartarius]|uniref:Radical SAM protein n=1 Tax=Paenibacillus chartarius TaxID=747481 RepID=A0ABV6DJR2_9BACL